MGVHSLWSIISPTSRAVRLESLSRKRLAVDASIWIYQFLKAMRSKDGQKLNSSHIIGFFRRICKLLYFRIQPVFVFDGGAPVLKKETISRRKERRLGKRESADKAAKRLLALQLQRQENKPKEEKLQCGEKEIEYHYLEDQDKSKEQLKEQEFANFKNTDDYYCLPKIKGFEYSKSDTRILNEEEHKEMVEQLDELDGIDLNKIDPNSAEFEALPLTTQYMILSQLRIRSRLRMGYSKEQLEQIFPDSKDFSKFQIAMAAKRNFYTTRLMNLMDAPNGQEKSISIQRVAGERDREYKIQKTEGGWSLSLDGKGTSSNPIDVDKEEKANKPFEINDSDSEVEWEDVPLDGIEKVKINQSISSLPLPPSVALSGVGDGTIRSFSFNPNTKKHQPKLEENKTDDDFSEKTSNSESLNIIQESKVKLTKQQSPKKKLFEVEVKKAQDRSDSESDSNGDDFFQDIPFTIIPETVEPKKLKPSKDSSEPFTNLKLPNFKVPEIKIRKEMDHLLNLKATLPNSNNLQEYENKKEEEEKGEEEYTQRKKPDTPLWFNSSFTNPFKSLKKEKDDLVSFHESQEFLKNKECESDKEDAVIEIDPKDFALNDKDKGEKIKDTKITIEPINNLKEIEEHTTSKIKISNSPSKITNSERSKVELQVLDYEFYESEEEELVNQLNQEEAEHEEFQKTSNPNLVTPTLDTLGLFSSINKQHAKDLRDSDEVTIEIVKEVQELLSYFGIPYITAPMEAEAQCAKLLQLKLVDGIITDDSDVFLFGGDKVYKNMFHEKHYVEYYDGKTIEKELGLDRSKLIELALLLGSDYTEGLKNIGPVNSMEIIAEFGNLTEFRKWFVEGQFNLNIQSKESTFQKKLRKKLIKSEIVLDNSFPDQRVKQAYIQPEVDSDKADFKWGKPDLDRLRKFLMNNVGWSKDHVDEVLVPLIRDLNKKKRDGLQSTLGEFYEIEQITFSGKKPKNKRVAKASAQIKKRKK